MTSDDNKPWRVLAQRKLLENPWFAVHGREVRLPSGRVIDFQSIDFPRPAVGIVPRRNGQILLNRQYRLTIDQMVWAIPSGGVDIGEDAETAARRELLEETGLEATTLRPLVAYYPSYGATNQLFLTFLAEEPITVSDSFDRDEVIDTRWFSCEEVLRMMFANEMVDGLSVTPLAMLLLEEAHSAKGGCERLSGSLPARSP